MIEERAIVRRVEGAIAWVEGRALEGCALCARGEGCGGGLLGRLLRPGSATVPAERGRLALAPGDPVIVGLSEHMLWHAALLAYLLPLLAMLLAAVLAAHAGLPDLLTALAALTGLGAGFLGLRLHAQRAELAGRYRPVVLRKDSNSSGPCARL